MEQKKTPFSRLSFWAVRILVLILALYIAIPVIRQVRGEYETETVSYITVTESGMTSGCISVSSKFG